MLCKEEFWSSKFIFEDKNVTIILLFQPSFLIVFVECLLVLESMTRKMKAHWVVSESPQQILIGGYCVPIIELNLLRRDPKLYLLELFCITDRGQNVIKVIVGSFEHQRWCKEERKMSLALNIEVTHSSYVWPRCLIILLRQCQILVPFLWWLKLLVASRPKLHNMR